MGSHHSRRSVRPTLTRSAKVDGTFHRDTLLIMNLSHEYNVARTHVRSLDFSMLPTRAGCEGKEGPQVHLFETVIRYLGGLLSAYE